jgi:hypothetical protein
VKGYDIGLADVSAALNFFVFFHKKDTSWVQTWVQTIKKALHDTVKGLSVELQGQPVYHIAFASRPM